MGKKENIVRAAEAVGFRTEFETQKRNGKTDKLVTFSGSTDLCSREFEVTVFYDVLDDIPKELIERHYDFDVDEEVRLYLNAANNGLSGVPDVCTLVDDVRDEEKQIGELADAVSAGINGKMPKSAKKEAAVYAQDSFLKRIQKELDDPASPLTRKALDRLNEIGEEEFHMPLEDILRDWSSKNTVIR